jgi:hypothetical protein
VALNRDIGQLESLIEELLTYARLDRCFPAAAGQDRAEPAG